VSAGIAAACHGIAAVCLSAAFLVALAQQATNEDRAIWPAVLVIVALGGLLAAVAHERTVFRVVAYLTLGGALTYLFASIVLTQVPVITSSGGWLFSMLKVALVMVGAVGVRLPGVLLPAIAGWVIGEGATAGAALTLGYPVTLDVAPALALLLIAVVGIGTALRRPVARRDQSAIHRAAMDERVAALRAGVETRATALLHDTVLNDLAAIAAGRPGPLSPGLRTKVQQDLEAIVGQDWSQPAEGAPELPSGVWEASRISQVLEDEAAAGLAVTLSGDRDAVATLDREVDDALGLAVRQLLVNVRKHSGVSSAEVVVYGGGGMVSVMVIDSGRGFDEAAVQRDRFGLRTSVRSRIAAVDGRVQVWSAPGRGTSVLLQVPDGLPAQSSAGASAAAGSAR
jgi:signal transduction histidine kinase